MAEADVTMKALIDAVCACTTDPWTVSIAEWVTMKRGGRASAHLHYYLEGRTLPIHINISELFRDDPGLERKVTEAISRDLKALTPRVRGRVALPQNAFSMTLAAQDWRYAIGSLNMDWRVVSNGAASREAEVELSFQNEYRWHPHDPRVTQCVHRAAENLKLTGARDYWMYGTPLRVKISY